MTGAVNGPPGDFTAMWAAADDQVDVYLAMLRSTRMTTADFALVLLSQDNQHIKLNLAILASTALQRLAATTNGHG